jgi:N-acetylglucosaminyldiphosphoundecaprenol N-acetyl-beta-D-mannosaminyltransferase
MENIYSIKTKRGGTARGGSSTATNEYRRQDGMREELRLELQSLCPGVGVVRTFSPHYRNKFSDQENEEVIGKISDVRPDVLWVSLPAPKQDYWIYENFDKLDVNIAIGVGAAFDVIAGNIPRAPEWMQKAGLEWFYRFLKEPTRLFNRYIIEAPKFIPLVLRQVLKKKVTENAR